MAEVFRDVRGNRAVAIGGKPPDKVVEGLKGLIRSQDATTKEIQNVSGELKILGERTERLAVQSVDVGKVATGIADAIALSLSTVTASLLTEVKSTLDDVTLAARRAAEQHAQVAQQSRTAVEAAAQERREEAAEPEMPDPPTVQDRKPAPAAPEPVQPRRRLSQAEVDAEMDKRDRAADEAEFGPEPEAESPLKNTEMWERGKAFNMGSLRQSLAKAASEFERAPMHEIRDIDGVQHRILGGGPNGIISREVTETDLAENAARALTDRRVAAYGASIAQEESIAKGVMNVLPGALGKAAGIAGATYAIGTQLADRSQTWRNANMEYRSVTGEGAMGAMQDRVESQRFQAGQRLRQLPGLGGGLDEASAQQLYRGVAAAGLNDEQRDRALDFATKSFREFGMDVSTSVDLITKAAAAGQPELTGVAEALNTVTEAAVQGGVNAAKAREQFVQAYGQALPNFGGQGVAATVAGGATAAMAALGNEYADQDVSGAFSTQMMRIVARANGMDFNDVVATSTAEGGADYLEMVDRQRVGQAGTILGQQGQQQVLSWKNDPRNKPAGENGTYTTEQIQGLSAQLEDTMGMDAEGLAMMLENPVYGLGDVEVRNAYDMLTQVATGNLNMGEAARAQASDARRRDVTTDEDRKSVAQRLGLKEEAGSKGLRGGVRRWAAETKGELAESIMDPLATFGIGDGGNDAAIRTQYMDRVLETGKSSANVEKLLAGYDDSIRLKIKTGDGEYRDMSIAEAIKYAPEQLERGEVEIIGSSNEDQVGRSVADAFGGVVDENVEGKDAEYKKRFGRDVGKKYDPDERAGGNDGKITVVPGPRLEEWFQFQTNGPAFVGLSRGERPANPADRPSGNPRAPR